MSTSDYFSLYPTFSKERVREIIIKMYRKYEESIIKQPSIPKTHQNVYYLKEAYPFIGTNERNIILRIFQRHRRNLWILGQMIPHTPEIDTCMEKIMKDIQNIEYLYMKKGV